MGNLEKFLRDDPVATPVLIKAAVAHAQLETIHPFLDGVLAVAEGSTDTIRRIVGLVEQDRRRVLASRYAATLGKVYDRALRSVMITPRATVRNLADDMTQPTVYRRIRDLEDLGILREITGRGRSRIHVYDAYLEILNEGVT